MGVRIGLILALVTSTAAAVSWVAKPLRLHPGLRLEARPSLADGASPIDDLDRCLQEFLHEEDGFGIARIPTVTWHEPRFAPKTPEQAAAVSRLKEAGVVAGFYLGGLGLLKTERPPTPREEWDTTHVLRVLTEPIYLTDTGASDDLPRSRDLWTLGREALAAFDSAEVYRGSLGRWTVEARPVRADRQDCLECHKVRPDRGGDGGRPLRIGDALGVILYIYAPSSPGS